MARYRLNLHDGSMALAATQSVELDHDGDALDLAQIALLSTTAYTHAEVYRDDALIGAVARDRYSMASINVGNGSRPDH